jgi:hypothetical protein
MFPCAGYDARLMPTPVADSGIVLVAATHHDPAEDKIGDQGNANVWGSAGNMGGESTATTTVPSTQILNFTRNLATKTIVAALDLSFTVRAAQGRLSALRVSPRKSVLCGAFVRVRRALKSRRRRFARKLGRPVVARLERRQHEQRARRAAHPLHGHR